MIIQKRFCTLIIHIFFRFLHQVFYEYNSIHTLFFAVIVYHKIQKTINIKLTHLLYRRCANESFFVALFTRNGYSVKCHIGCDDCAVDKRFLTYRNEAVKHRSKVSAYHRFAYRVGNLAVFDKEAVFRNARKFAVRAGVTARGGARITNWKAVL